MTIKTELADGTFEIFHNDNYKVSTIKDMHPVIVSVAVFDNGKCIFKKSRFLKWFYKKITFKSRKVQSRLEEIERARQMQEVAEAAKA